MNTILDRCPASTWSRFCSLLPKIGSSRVAVFFLVMGLRIHYQRTRSRSDDGSCRVGRRWGVAGGWKPPRGCTTSATHRPYPHGPAPTRWRPVPARRQHADALLCRLVAHHSCAIIEASERGLADVLSLEFEPAPYALSSVLICCDMTTSPDGELVPAGQRLAERQDRYGPGHLVSRSIQHATPMILGAVKQIHHRAAQTA
jgi:hypothetical protein